MTIAPAAPLNPTLLSQQFRFCFETTLTYSLHILTYYKTTYGTHPKEHESLIEYSNGAWQIL